MMTYFTGYQNFYIFFIIFILFFFQLEVRKIYNRNIIFFIYVGSIQYNKF